MFRILQANFTVFVCATLNTSSSFIHVYNKPISLNSHDTMCKVLSFFFHYYYTFSIFTQHLCVFFGARDDKTRKKVNKVRSEQKKIEENWRSGEGPHMKWISQKSTFRDTIWKCITKRVFFLVRIKFVAKWNKNKKFATCVYCLHWELYTLNIGPLSFNCNVAKFQLF